MLAIHRFLDIPVQNPANEVMLGLGVHLPIFRERFAESLFQIGISFPNIRVSPQSISESEIIVPLRVAQGHDMKMDRSDIRFRLADEEMSACITLVPTVNVTHQRQLLQYERNGILNDHGNRQIENGLGR